MATVKYHELDLTVPGQNNKTILEHSIEHQIPHLHECGGNGKCTTCRVRILAGKDQLSPATLVEQELSKRLKWEPNIRLACQCKVEGDIEIERLLWNSPEINALQLESIPLGKPEERPIGILSCDIRGFTSISSQLTTFDVAHLLDKFYTYLGDPIILNNGIIYQYVGDEIIGIFGIDGTEKIEVCKNIVRAALGMQYAVQRLNKYELRGLDVTLKIGIGINYGPAFLGHLGHPKHKLFTVIGDTMNLANRIQSSTKTMAATILISDDIFNTMPEDLLEIGKSEHQDIAGKEEKMLLHEVLRFKQMDMHLELQSSLNLILKDDEGFAALFYERLFERLPEVKPLFKKSLRNQGKLLMHMLLSIVQGLSRPTQLKMGLKALGRNHAKYGVKESYYPVLIEVLLECITEKLGDQATENTVSSWREALDFITGVMAKA